MQFHEFEPDPSLARHVLQYWKFVAGDFEDVPYMHHVAPDGCVSLVYGLPIVDTPGWIGLSGPRLNEIRVPVRPVFVSGPMPSALCSTLHRPLCRLMPSRKRPKSSTRSSAFSPDVGRSTMRAT